MSPRIFFFLPAVLAAVGATASVGAAQAEVEVTLQLARTTLHECEPLWVSFRFLNRSDRQLGLTPENVSFLFERREKGEWRPAPGYGCGGCEWMLCTSVVAPEGALHGETRLGEILRQLEPGEHRMRVRLPAAGEPGTGYSVWHEFTVLPHPGNREFLRRLAAAPRAETAGLAAARFLSGGARSGWVDESRARAVGFPVGLTLRDYQRHLRAFAVGADLSPGLAAELQHDLVAIEVIQAHHARHAGDETSARKHATAGLALLATIDLSSSQRLETGGQSAGIRESRIDLLSFTSPELAATERQRLQSEFPLRRGAVRVACE
ncbi:MAG: hypothetical protein JNM84_10200 [Planctomycetes bacterium]|nr:hypothetical protein [Planctomycetota bacterium]